MFFVLMTSLFMAHADLTQVDLFTPECEASLITPQFRLLIDDHEHVPYRRELEREIDRRTRDKGLPIRPTHINGIRDFEQVMFLLAQGDSDSVIPIVRTAAFNVDDSSRRLNELADFIVPVQKMGALSEANTKKLVDAEKEFLKQSQILGDSYGAAKNMLMLLESVAAGKGVPDVGDIVTYEGDVSQAEVVLDLSGKHSIAAAQRALDLIWKWNNLPDLSTMKQAFGNNNYAIRAKLERDVTELKGLDSITRKTVNIIAWLATTTTDMIPRLPEKYRQIAMRLAGMQVDKFMKELYVGRIQRLVNITRRRTPDGKLVIVNDPQALDTLAAAVKAQMPATWANDMLTTYARLGYFSKSWKQLKAVLEETAKNDPLYAKLATMAEDAQKGAISAGDLIYVYEKDGKHEATLLLAQAGYQLAIEESSFGGLRKYLWPMIANFFN